MALNYAEIEPKWQKAWVEAKVYESEPDERKGILINVPFPYVNTPLHIGHLRTYATTDFHARYKRHRGYNVLFPMAFHATGTPILAIAKRITNKDKELIEELHKFEIPDSDIAKMEDIYFIVDYMIGITEEAFKQSGLGIDWRRKFRSIEPIFSKMVEWQFARLNAAGLLKQGSHPVGWCPNEGNAVGQHDTRGDAEPEIEKLIAVGFKDADTDAIFPCTTYRPETIDGVTNLFVGEKVEYVKARIGGKSYFMSKDAATRLAYQMQLEVEGPVSASGLLKKNVINPSNGERLPILPGFFVEAEVGTGIVMSVPAHAPFDYAALERLKGSGIQVPQGRSVIRIERPNNPPKAPTGEEIERARKADHSASVEAYLELLKQGGEISDEVLEVATKLVYREESRWGVMAYGKYLGRKETDARGLISADLISSGSSFNMYELTNPKPVFCRCGTRVVVKTVEGQWFINYGDKKWKEDTRKHMRSMRMHPEGSMNTFEKVMDWIDMRATERAQGLGTPFPLNKSHIIESLSDSTIYMSLYTYIHILRDSKVSAEQLKPEFFDFVLSGKGDAGSVSKSTGIDELALKKCRDSFVYWYSDTARHSGSDLIYNHLVMYLFNHVALFDRKFWPKQIVTNGLVNYEGQKMSKSLGNIIPIKIGIRNHGVDPLRFIEVVGAELGSESDFRVDEVKSIRTKNDFLHKLITSLPEMKSAELSHNDFWLYSKLNSKIKRATELLDGMLLKEAYIDIYYNSVTELRRYLERGGSNGMVLRDFLEKLTVMISPIMPHVAEEFWHELGKASFVVKESWPEPDASMINPDVEQAEALIDSTVSDVRQGIELTSKIPANSGKNVKEITIIVADDWKTAAYNRLARERNMAKAVSSDSLKGADKEKVSKFLSQFAKRASALVEVPRLPCEYVVQGFNDSKDYLSEKLGAPVSAVMESNSSSPRAPRAMPGKPAIDITWE
ncbi:MAG: leucine--tRNA ligase [Candidatus Micrarchaeota archaeon]|nr:leucine--tRNA ligase [Candidatus Micrarchaeota archaeon]